MLLKEIKSPDIDSIWWFCIVSYYYKAIVQCMLYVYRMNCRWTMALFGNKSAKANGQVCSILATLLAEFIAAHEQIAAEKMVALVLKYNMYIINNLLVTKIYNCAISSTLHSSVRIYKRAVVKTLLHRWWQTAFPPATPHAEAMEKIRERS